MLNRVNERLGFGRVEVFALQSVFRSSAIDSFILVRELNGQQLKLIIDRFGYAALKRTVTYGSTDLG